MGAVRFLIAGSILLAWSALREGPGALRISRRELRDSLVVGIALLGGGMGLVALAEQTVPSGITALLIALMPAWVAVLGRVFFGERLPAVVIVGIVVGLAGVAILVAPTGGNLSLDPGGLAAVLLSPISWATGSLYATHRARQPGRPLVATGLQMLGGALALTVASLATGELARFSPTAVSSNSAWALAYLVVVGSLVAYTTYVWLLRVAPLPCWQSRSPRGRSWRPSSSWPRWPSSSRRAAGPDPRRWPSRRAAIPQLTSLRRPPTGPRRSAPRPSALGQNRPRNPASQEHDRDHRVDPDRGREQ
jgi:drug/metabolite transporter (DMT)-like permease